ncbi:serine/threonine-protein phosphatase 6 regulatory subunit 3-like protein [Tanacetum coccineum]
MTNTALANNLSQAFRYGISENDDNIEASGSLDRDDEDAYFDDESAEAFISSLHLGDDDQERSFNSLWSQDVHGDPEQRHKTFLRSFIDRAFLLQRLQPTSITLSTCQLAFPIAVLEHKYIKLICTGYLDSATEEAMEEFRRFEEEM